MTQQHIRFERPLSDGSGIALTQRCVALDKPCDTEQHLFVWMLSEIAALTATARNMKSVRSSELIRDTLT